MTVLIKLQFVPVYGILQNQTLFTPYFSYKTTLVAKQTINNKPYYLIISFLVGVE